MDINFMSFVVLFVRAAKGQFDSNDVCICIFVDVYLKPDDTSLKVGGWVENHSVIFVFSLYGH